MKYVEQNCWSSVNNFNFWCKVRALDRFQYKLEGERSELKIFVTIFPHYNLLIKHFFSIISWTNYFFPTSSWTNYLFSKICWTIFFSQKNHSPPKESNGRPLITVYQHLFWRFLWNRVKDRLVRPLELQSFFFEKSPYRWILTFFILKFPARSVHTVKQDRCCGCDLFWHLNLFL